MDVHVLPASVEEAIKSFDEGAQIGSVEMDGTGPVAELQVQLLMIEILRHASKFMNGEASEVRATFNTIARDLVGKLAVADKLGEITDEQRDAAISLAYSFATEGWNKTLMSVAPDSRLLICNFFPSVV
jgi:hypothetical protein